MRHRFLFFAILAQCLHAQVSPGGEAEAGKKLFASHCSVGYCHGAEGRAGRGPRLRDREWDRNYLFKVIDEGIPNSSMPAWRGKLSNEQMASIVVYILSISQEITQPGASAPRHQEAATPNPATAAASAGPGIMGNAAAGKSLFFDATNERNCGVCHKVAGSGGDAGSELDKLAAQPARDIVKRILIAGGSSNRKPMEIVTKDGETLRGVLVEENGSRLRMYDLTSPGPPVARTLSSSDVVQRHPLGLDIAHDNLARTYTIQQLLDIVTYLKSPDAPAKVRLEDLF